MTTNTDPDAPPPGPPNPQARAPQAPVAGGGAKRSGRQAGSASRTGDHSGVRAARQERTRGRLLDAAEELFAERGFYGVGVRDITHQAGTRLAAVNDSFGGKDNLFAEVLRRRLHPLNADRRARLTVLPGGGPRARRLRALIDAFARPMLDRAHDPGWQHYFRLTAQPANTSQPALSLVAEDYNSIATDVIGRLRAIFPDTDEAALHDAYLYLVAAVTNTFATTGRLDSLTQGRLHTDDLNDRYASLMPFLCGGITRLATTRQHTC